MNVNDFSNILKNPQGISSEQIREITSILEEYPYFHAARALHLKILYTQKDYKYNQALKVAAAHITNRTVLYEFINFQQIQIQEVNQIKSPSNTSVSGQFFGNIQGNSIDNNQKNDENWIISNEINRNFSSREVPKRNPNYTEPAWFFNIEVVPENVSQNIAEALKSTSNSNQETKRDISEKIDSFFGNNKIEDLSDWTQKTNYYEVTDENTAKSSDGETKNKFELIDRFLETNPKIEPSKDYEPKVDLADKNKVDSNKFMTETLAKVYLKQRKFEQAIEAYEILILKNPEKSAFFADQIRAIKNLQQNNL